LHDHVLAAHIQNTNKYSNNQRIFVFFCLELAMDGQLAEDEKLAEDE